MSMIENSQVTDYFVECYNGKYKDNALDPKKIHAENAGGSKFHADDIVEVAFIHKEHVYIKNGAPPRNEAKRLEEKENDPTLLTCQNYGCQYRYREEDNDAKACWHHKKGPVFWNGYKYWACCSDRKAYDWNDFMKVPGCVCGPHTTEKPKGAELISPTIIAARQAEAEETARASVPKLNDINNYTEKTMASKPKPKPKPKEVLPDGCARCVHQSCKKLYEIAKNHEKACKYHSGHAVFHDGAKYWSCCTENRKTYDWDAFEKIPKCCIGYHWDGSGSNPNPGK